MDINRIIELEQKYLNKIIKVFHEDNDEFLTNLLEVEEYINADYEALSKFWGIENKLKLAAERLLRFHLYRKLEVENIYPSPLSPDVAVVLEDVVLCVDAKTINMYGNLNDEKYVQIQKNQITFKNISASEKKDWPGLPFPPQLKAYFEDKNGKKKPCLTYTINFCYEDDRSTFKLSHISFCSIPHAEIVNTQEFNNDLLQGFKSWDYLELDNVFGDEYNPIDKSDPKFNKLIEEGVLSPVYNSSNKIDAYIDYSVNHPILSDDWCLRKDTIAKKKGYWRIALYGGNARIPKSKLKIRNLNDSNDGKKWIGVREFKIESSYESTFFKTENYWGRAASNPKGLKQRTLEKYNEIQSLKSLGKPSLL